MGGGGGLVGQAGMVPFIVTVGAVAVTSVALPAENVAELFAGAGWELSQLGNATLATIAPVEPAGKGSLKVHVIV